MRFVLLIIMIFTINSHSFTQTYNNVEFKKIQIDSIALGSKKTQLITKFGKPNKISKSSNPSADDTWFNYYYKKSILQVSPKGFFIGFKLFEKKFTLTYNKINFKIGDTLASLFKVFPLSSKSYKKDSDNKFRLKFKDSDSYLLFNCQNGLITSIETWDEL